MLGELLDRLSIFSITTPSLALCFRVSLLVAFPHRIEWETPTGGVASTSKTFRHRVRGYHQPGTQRNSAQTEAFIRPKPKAEGQQLQSQRRGLGLISGTCQVLSKQGYYYT